MFEAMWNIIAFFLLASGILVSALFALFVLSAIISFTKEVILSKDT